MKKLKIYIETSVISHLKSEDVLEKMEITLKLWEDIKSGIYDIILSDAVIIELSRCSEHKRNILQKFLDEINYEVVEISEEADKLALDIFLKGLFLQNAMKTHYT